MDKKYHIEDDFIQVQVKGHCTGCQEIYSVGMTIMTLDLRVSKGLEERELIKRINRKRDLLKAHRCPNCDPYP